MAKGRSLQGMDPARTREVARLGGLAKAANRAAEAEREAGRPYAGAFLEFLEATGRSGPSRAVWRVFWKAADSLPLAPDELVIFQRHTGRTVAPVARPVECWVVAGRGGGKSVSMVERATWRAISFDRAPLAAGEQAVIPLVASDRAQARNSLAYLRGLAASPLVEPFVHKILEESIAFRTGVVVQVHTASYRALRGYSMIDAVCEEVAFWSADDSLNADVEVVGAMRPALIRVPGSRLYGISSPYARRGILWQMFERHWGRDDSDVLVFCADTASLNPTVDRAAIAREFEDDPARAASEYGQEGLVAFRSDVESFLSVEALEAVRIPDRFELPPAASVRYVGFTDPSGGSRDSWTLAIAHAEGERAVLDCVREVRPRFSPDAVCSEYAQVLQSYGLTEVTGDHYASVFPVELFAKHGIAYRQAADPKSVIYGLLLPLVNAKRAELLDLPRLRAQLLALERRTARGGRDSIDHPPGGHDDVANAAAGALVLAQGGPQQITDIHIPELRADHRPELASGPEYYAGPHHWGNE